MYSLFVEGEYLAVTGNCDVDEVSELGGLVKVAIQQ